MDKIIFQQRTREAMNIKAYIKIFCFGLFFVVTSICVGGNSSGKGDNKSQQRIAFTDPLRPIMVTRSKPVFAVTLKSNPTTGYSWLLRSYDKNLITPVSRKFYPATNKKFMIGAPGYEKWIFRIKPLGFVVPQTTSITLVYVRPWDDQSAQTINFRVVTSNAN